MQNSELDFGPYRVHLYNWILCYNIVTGLLSTLFLALKLNAFLQPVV